MKNSWSLSSSSSSAFTSSLPLLTLSDCDYERGRVRISKATMIKMTGITTIKIIINCCYFMILTLTLLSLSLSLSVSGVNGTVTVLVPDMCTHHRHHHN